MDWLNGCDGVGEHRQLDCLPVCKLWLRQLGGRNDETCLWLHARDQPPMDTGRTQDGALGGIGCQRGDRRPGDDIRDVELRRALAMPNRSGQILGTATIAARAIASITAPCGWHSVIVTPAAVASAVTART